MNKIQVLLFALLLQITVGLNINASASAKCKCVDFKSQSDCTTASCKWNNNACGDGVCTDIKAEQTCINSILGCGWKNNACEKFTQCSDYAATTSLTCVDRSISGKWCVDNAAKTACADASATCAAITVQANCSISAEGMCVWVNNACTKFTQCSQHTTQLLCEAYSCSWANNACAAKKCDSFKTSADCTHLVQVSNMSIDVCKWDSTKCIDSVDVAHLTSTTCIQQTDATYTWTGTACQKCGSSSYGILLMAGIVALLI